MIDMEKIETREQQNSPGLTEIKERHKNTQLWVLGITIACLWLGILIPQLSIARYFAYLTWFLFLRQDLLFVFLFLLIPVLLIRRVERPVSTGWMDILATPRGLCITLVCLVGVCWLGRHFIYLDYNLSRDEQMADFDAYVFAHGKLFWPLPKFWQAHALALNQMFTLTIGDHEGWVSGYLPVNAAMRMAVGLLVSPSLTSPLFVALGAVSLWRIAKRLWPNSSSTRGVALILYAGSSQVIVNGMSAYAMTGHLALDLVWLDLFLLNKRWSHPAALMVGFLATGLHQPLFHPLFVLPFLELLYLRRQWGTFAFYLSGYALIGAFWIAWPIWISSHGMGHIVPLDPGAPSYFRRFVLAVHPLNLEAIWLTALNLLRFITWQHLLFLPLLAAGIRATWKDDPLGRTIAKSFLLPIAVMLILLPYQGHGWGYRYLHGVIGNGCLLAGYGWAALEAQGLPLRRMLAWTTAITFLIVLPVRSAMVRHMIGGPADASRMIGNNPAQFAIVDNGSAPFGDDLVINRPDLSNRPIRLQATNLRNSDIPEICARGTIAFVEAPLLKPLGDFFGETPKPPSPHILDLKQAARRYRCDITSAGQHPQ